MTFDTTIPEPFSSLAAVSRLENCSCFTCDSFRLAVWTCKRSAWHKKIPPSTAAAAAGRCARVERRIQTESTASIFALFYNFAPDCCVSSGREAEFQPIRMKEKCFYFKALFLLLKQVWHFQQLFDMKGVLIIFVMLYKLHDFIQ